MRRTGLSKGGLKFKAPALINAANNSQVPKEIHNEVLKTEKEKNKNDQDDTTEEDKQMIIEEKPENSKEQKRTRDEFQSSLEKPQPKKALLHTPKTNTTPETQKSPTSATYWTCFHTKVEFYFLKIIIYPSDDQ